MIKSNLCDYSDAYIHVKVTMTVPNIGTAPAPNNRNKIVIFKNCASFTNCRSEIYNTEVDDAHGIDVVMPMYDFIEYSGAYLKTSRSSWKYNTDEPALSDKENIMDFPYDSNDSISFKFKQQITWQAGNNEIKDVKIMVPLKYLTYFWRTMEIPLINCEISLMLTWSKNWFFVAGAAANQESIFAIIDTKLYVSVVTLSTEGNVKLLKQLESGFFFKKKNNWNKYQSN